MKNGKTQYVCTSCGAVDLKWNGQCTSCKEWNTLKAFNPGQDKHKDYDIGSQSDRSLMGKSGQTPISINDIVSDPESRLLTYSPELNRVLGGGIVPGSIVLIGGQPGVGKSTLLLQLAGRLPGNVLYVSGEESAQQIKDRADRLGISKEDLFLLSASSLELIVTESEKLKPGLLIVDSIQTIFTDAVEQSPGTVTQLRECAGRMMRYAKQSNIPVMLIGHITKDGLLGGPKVLEHIVDVVLLFDGDMNHHYRLLRAQKNRYGSTEEIGIFEMKQAGLMEVDNPSGLLLSNRSEQLPGNAIAAIMEGRKSLLIEVQALVSTSVFGHPQRNPNGFDLRRMQMLLAVIEKRKGFLFSQKDVFLNIAGGIKSADPATDLAVVAGLMSSFLDFDIPATSCFAGEVGLAGEIRPVKRIENRITEAERMGMTKIYIPNNGLDHLNKSKKIKVIGLNHLNELYDALFE